jgi:hypothetical protein
MRSILPFLIAVSVASRCSGEPINLWILEVFDYRYLDGNSSFRVSTRADAFLEHSGCCSMSGGATPESDPFAAAFADDLTNGKNNPITIVSPYFSYTIDEDFLLGSNFGNELNIKSWTNLDAASTNGIDLEGWRITGFGLGITTTTNGIWGYGVAAWGEPIPEPSCGAMLLAMALSLSVQFARRRTKTSVAKLRFGS